jgi:hypothetical protein
VAVVAAGEGHRAVLERRVEAIPAVQR